MYHAEFINAKDYYGKPIREQGTGNLIGYCSHVLMAKVKTKTVDEHYGELTFTRQAFDGLELICLRCGNFYWVNDDDLVNEETWDKKIKEALADFEKPQILEKPPKRKKKSS